jgi:hypothetical protein
MITEWEAVHQKIFDECLKLQPKWRSNQKGLKKVIAISVVDGDEYKRVVVGGKKYLVPIVDIVCIGIRVEEVPFKYKEAGK